MRRMPRTLEELLITPEWQGSTVMPVHGFKPGGIRVVKFYYVRHPSGAAVHWTGPRLNLRYLIAVLHQWDRVVPWHRQRQIRETIGWWNTPKGMRYDFWPTHRRAHNVTSRVVPKRKPKPKG